MVLSARALLERESREPWAADSLAQAVILFVDESVTISTVRALRTRYPTLVISVCTEDATLRRLSTLGRAGADDMTLVGDQAHARGLAVWVRERLDAPARTIELMELRQRMSSAPVVRVLEYCLRNAVHVRTVGAVAAWFGWSERTLRRRMALAGLPDAEAVLRCAHLLLVLEQERRGISRREEQARRAGFRSAKALSAAVGTLRQRVAVEQRLRRFVEQVPSLSGVLVENRYWRQ